MSKFIIEGVIKIRGRGQVVYASMKEKRRMIHIPLYIPCLFFLLSIFYLVWHNFRTMS